jgi:DNA-binding LacI/PurR family transcriptional regulator
VNVVKSQRLHERVADLLRDRIGRGMRAGARLEALPVLAAEFGVSVNTLRAALGLLSQEGMVESRPGSGVYVTDFRERLPIAVFCDLDLSFPGLSSFWLSITQSVRRQLRERGIRERPYLGYAIPTEVQSQPSCPELLEDVRAERLRGVLAVMRVRQPAYGTLFRAHPIPTVNLGLPDSPPPETNEDEVVAATIRRLVAGGRRRIAILASGYRSRLTSSCTPVAETLRALGLRIPGHWLRDELAPNLPGAGWEQFRELWGAAREKPDALLALDDVLFRDAALAITELGIDVPRQLHVTVHVNRGGEPYCPFPVDRIVMDPERYAARLVEDMVSRLAGGAVNPEPVRCVTAEYTVPLAAPGDAAGTALAARRRPQAEKPARA